MQYLTPDFLVRETLASSVLPKRTDRAEGAALWEFARRAPFRQKTPCDRAPLNQQTTGINEESNMAITKSTPTQAEQVSQPTPQQIVNEGIARVIEATGIDVQKNRYKAMRAIAWQAFANSIDAGTFDKLVALAIVNVGELPSGWEIEVPPKVALKDSPAKKTAAR